jgi:hypothetical protein
MKIDPATESALCSDELFRRKVTGGEELPRRLVGDRGALVEALRERMRGG